jgi:hypothetical protein
MMKEGIIRLSAVAYKIVLWKTFMENPQKHYCHIIAAL